MPFLSPDLGQQAVSLCTLEEYPNNYETSFQWRCRFA